MENVSKNFLIHSIKKILSEDVPPLSDSWYKRPGIVPKSHLEMQQIKSTVPVQKAILWCDRILQLLNTDEHLYEIIDYLTEGIPVMDHLMVENAEVGLINMSELNELQDSQIPEYLQHYIISLKNSLKSGSYSDTDQQLIHHYSVIVGFVLNRYITKEL